MKLDDLFVETAYSSMNGFMKLKNYELEDFINYLPNYEFKQNIYLIKSEVVKEIVGKPIVDRVFAFTYRKGKLLYQEIIRKFESCKYCSVKNMYFGDGFGYRVAWNKTNNYYWMHDRDYGYWLEYSKDFGDGLWTTNITTKEEYEEILAKRPDLKYLSWNFKGYLSYLATIYKTYPELEILEKLDLLQLMNVSCFNYIRKNKAFVGFLFKNQNNKDAKFTDFKRAYLKNGDIEELREKRINEINATKSFNLANITNKIILANKEKIYEYIKRNHIDLTSYADMIKAMELFEVDFNDTKNIMPKDFKEIHDRYTKAYSERMSKELNEQINSIRDKYKELDLFYKDVHFKLPKEKAEFIDEGKRMDNCVGYMNYDERMAKGKILIVFIRDEQDKSLATMEFSLERNKIIQLRAKHNSNVSEDLEKLVNKVWLPKAKKIVEAMAM